MRRKYPFQTDDSELQDLIGGGLIRATSGAT
jgi:hypothetical protein